MYSDVVKGLSKSRFEEIIDEMKKERNIELDTEFSEEDLKEMVAKFKAFYKEETERRFPSDPKKSNFSVQFTPFSDPGTIPVQFIIAKSTTSPPEWGNRCQRPRNGLRKHGRHFRNRRCLHQEPGHGREETLRRIFDQRPGEDVVAGVRTPSPISTLAEEMPEIYTQFEELANKLEKHFRDMQDIEFTIENGKLFILQTRSGKRTAQLRFALLWNLWKRV